VFKNVKAPDSKLISGFPLAKKIKILKSGLPDRLLFLIFIIEKMLHEVASGW